jgi:hypothetical protein
MWCIDTLEVVPVRLDFSSSGQGRRTARALHANGACLINALELVEFDAAATQVHVCSSCGYSQCESGNWVALRRAGPFVVWIPAFAQLGAGEWERQEYSPPYFIATRGAPFFTLSAWQQLRGLHDGVPDASELPPLNGQEVVRVIQWSAPRRVLDAYPAPPRLQREAIVGVTDGDIDGEVHAVDRALTRYFESATAITIMSDASVSSRIEFWLDLPGVPMWNAFARSEAGIVLLLDEKYVCVLAG